jgi:hypothetical protein
LLEYYIVVPPPNEFCELHIFMWRGVQEFLANGMNGECFISDYTLCGIQKLKVCPIEEIGIMKTM